MSTGLTVLAYRTFGAAIAFFTFCTYPIALIPYRLGGGDSYYMRLPALVVLTFLSVPILLTGLEQVQKRWRICLTILAVAVIINLLRQPADWQRTIGFIGYLSVPLAMALYTRQATFRWSRTVVVLAGLWLLLMIYGFDARSEVIGITGNRNWMAICLLATAPWGAIAIYALCRGLRRQSWRLAIAAVAISPVLVLIHRCACRAAWVALGCYLLFAGVSRLRARARFLVLALIVVIGGIAVIANRDRVVRIIDKDIRIPVWETAAQLAADHPVIGTGPGRFINVYAEYLTTSPYHHRAVASETIEHPHNEFLNIAANIGIPAALAWLIAILPLLRLPRGTSVYLRIAHFSAFVIYLHAMLDKPLVQPPSSIIALCCLGLLYGRCVLVQATTAGGATEPVDSAGRWKPALFAVIVVFSLWHTIDMIRLGWMQRGAAHYEFAGDYERAFDCYDAVTQIAPRRIDGWYGCGAIAIEKFLDPKRALPYLEKAHAMDPNYAHINRFLGQAYGTMRQRDIAVDYFARDCELHPFDPDTVQYYFVALERNGPPYTELHTLDRRLKRLYIERARWDRSAVTPQWCAAAKTDLAAVKLVGEQLLFKAPGYFVDPLFHDYAPSEWPATAVYARSGELDYAYWRDIGRMASFLADLPTNDHSTALQIARALAKTTRLQPEAPFNLPARTLESGTGSALSRAALFAFLCQGAEIPTILLETQESVFAAVPDGARFIVFDMATAALTPTATDAGELRTLLLQSKGPRIYCAPQSFMLRNQLIGVYVRRYMPEFEFQFDQIPIVHILDTGAAFAEATVLDLNTCCLTEPFTLLYQETWGH
ncbi:MAG: O-antigen ligase family protein [Lentisphaeria bacterium]